MEHLELKKALKGSYFGSLVITFAVCTTILTTILMGVFISFQRFCGSAILINIIIIYAGCMINDIATNKIKALQRAFLFETVLY